ncbi:MFS transporter [Thermanaeromonas sp. C210]|uniref:MFS transporter n=1 Tax=Thermanaeromonas sp. C210 TaxID=2731925 RepID=UPI00155B641E|nr:MFS transporter [Thermanaeromonas sp. C210]GFN23322.1 MFS transporter [Thermanaeromonas sp. C210]
MKKNKRFLYLLSLGHLMTDVNQGLLPIFLPIYKEVLGLSFTAAGLVSLMSFISSSVIQPLFGFWSDRRASRWLIPAGCLVAALGMALAGWAPNYVALVASVFLSGLGVAAYHPEASKTAHYLSDQHRATSMAVFSVGGNLGFALGPVVAAWLLAHGGLKASPLLVIPAGLLSLLLWSQLPSLGRAVAGPYSGEEEAALSGEPSEAKDSNFKALLLLLVIVVIRSWLQAGLTNYIPFYYINYLQGDPSYSSMLLTVFLLAGALGTLVGGRIADRWGCKNMILVSLALMVPIVLLFPHTGGPWLFVLLALGGFTLVSTFAPTIVLAQNLMPGHVGMASGLIMGFAIGTGGIGLVIIGAVADALGVPAALASMALIPALGFALTLFLPDDARERRLSQAL